MSQIPNVKFRTYMPGDHLGIKLRADQADNPATDHMIAAQLSAGPSYTVVVDGVICAVGGLAEFWPGRMALWGFVDKDMPRRAWLKVAEHIQGVIDNLRHGCARIEVTVRADMPTHWNFARRLGFVKEATLHKFDGKQDHIMGVMPCL